jgi:putative zinc finger protein
MSNFKIENSPEHAEVAALIPWYLNATLSEQDRIRVDAHLSLCATCRDDLAVERRVFEGVTAESAIEYMPVASLNRLRARLDTAHADVADPDVAPLPYRRRRSLPWQGLMAASVALMAVAVGLLAADRWMQYRSEPAAANFHTVTSPAPRAADEAIRAVFTPTITLVELQSILDESQLRIVAGPTEAGVYSLALTGARPVNESLQLLRQHSTVRFAESTRLDTQP